MLPFHRHPMQFDIALAVAAVDKEYDKQAILDMQVGGAEEMVCWG